MVEKKVSIAMCKTISGEIKEDIKEIKVDVKGIKNNHLFHIEKDIATIMVWIKILTITYGATLTAFVGLVLKVIF